MSKYGPTWAELRSEFMTPEEMAESDANVKVIGVLLDALDAGRITQAEFDAAFDKLESSAEARRPSVRRRPSLRARPPRVAL